MERGPSADDNISMASIIEQMDASGEVAEDALFRAPQRGQMVEGTIASIDRDGILVDIGSKAEGMVAASEIPQLMSSPNPPVVGEQVTALVLRGEDREGRVLLSLQRGREEQGWRDIERLFNEGTIFDAPIREANRGGLIVDVFGLRGFVPMSQISGVRHDPNNEEETTNRLQAMVGQTVPVKVVELNRRRNRLILSERAAVQERRAREKDRLLTELQEGDTRPGVVTSLCDFGAFVDLGGADGLIHLSELSWGQVTHPSQVLKVGDEVDVFVVGVDRDKKKIALSLKRLQAEPWTRVQEHYQIGQVVTGRITKLAPFGAFAEIDEGVEGLIHISELADERITHPKSVIKEGDVVSLRIIRIDAARHRLGLSLRQAQEEEQDDVPSVYSQGPQGGATLGDLATGLQGLSEAYAAQQAANDAAEATPTNAAEPDATEAPADTTSPQGNAEPNPHAHAQA
jgi:small subunit ribosomal protein S1